MFQKSCFGRHEVQRTRILSCFHRRFHCFSSENRGSDFCLRLWRNETSNNYLCVLWKFGSSGRLGLRKDTSWDVWLLPWWSEVPEPSPQWDYGLVWKAADWAQTGRSLAVWDKLSPHLSLFWAGGLMGAQGGNWPCHALASGQCDSKTDFEKENKIESQE